MYTYTFIASIAAYKYLLLMQLLSFGTFYLGVEDVKFCSISVHAGSYLLEWTCPKTLSDGTIQNDDRSGDGETSESDGAIQKP